MLSNCCLAYLIIEARLELSYTATGTGTANAHTTASTANAANDAHAAEHGLRCGHQLRRAYDIAERMPRTRLMHLLYVIVRGNAAPEAKKRQNGKRLASEESRLQTACLTCLSARASWVRRVCDSS